MVELLRSLLWSESNTIIHLTDVSAVHYDRYDYMDEKREAMQAWDEALRIIING